MAAASATDERQQATRTRSGKGTSRRESRPPNRNYFSATWIIHPVACKSMILCSATELKSGPIHMASSSPGLDATGAPHLAVHAWASDARKAGVASDESNQISPNLSF